MELGSVLIFLAMLLLVALFISRPLFENRSVSVTLAEHQYSALLAERDRILDAIRELDMDNAMGKISEDVYTGQRTVLLQQGADVLRQMDELQTADPDLAKLEPAPAPALVAATQPQTMQPGSVDYDYDLENLVSARRQSKSGKATGFCHQCARPIQENDRFCAHCGATV